MQVEEVRAESPDLHRDVATLGSPEEDQFTADPTGDGDSDKS